MIDTVLKLCATILGLCFCFIVIPGMIADLALGLHDVGVKLMMFAVWVLMIIAAVVIVIGVISIWR